MSATLREIAASYLDFYHKPVKTARLKFTVNQSSAGGVLLAILLGQIAIAWWMWTRMVFYAAEIHLYKKLSPITAPKPAMVEPQLGFARAEGPEGRVG